MKLKVLGIALILIGFAIPFVLMSIVPSFMYGSVISIICFWIGFFLILHPIERSSLYNKHFQWARYAVLLNFALTILSMGYFYLVFYFEIHNGIAFSIMRLLGFISNPIRSIFDIIVSKPTVQNADGSVLITTSFIRILLYDFFNLIFYCLLGFFAKILIEKKITTASSRPLIDRRGC